MQQRSIDFLTPEQLQRKRERDRKSQKQNREQTRAYIKALETKVFELGQTVEDLERKSTNLEQQLSSLLEQYNTSQPNQGWPNVPLIQGCGAATAAPGMDGFSAQDFNWELIDGNCPALGTHILAPLGPQNSPLCRELFPMGKSPRRHHIRLPRKHSTAHWRILCNSSSTPSISPHLL
jgi:hypothetical protein